MPCTLTVIKPGLVKLQATQPGDGNSTYAPAEKIITELIVSKRELLVRVHDQYRKTTEPNPELTYDLLGFVGDDNESMLDQNITLSVSVTDGSTEFPSIPGDYPIVASDAFSELYFLSYANGLLTVSEKRRQQLIFDQNLSDTSALSPPIDLLGYSVEPALSGAIVSLYREVNQHRHFIYSPIAKVKPDFFFLPPLVRGQTYHFIADGISTDHPFMIGELYGDFNSSHVTGGPLTGSTGQITVTIPSDYQGNLFYFCTNHSSMIAAFTLSDPDQNQTRTELPLYYEIDDNSVARLIVTREEALNPIGSSIIASTVRWPTKQVEILEPFMDYPLSGMIMHGTRVNLVMLSFWMDRMAMSILALFNWMAVSVFRFGLNLT